MKIFDLLQISYANFSSAVKSYLSEALSKYNLNFDSNTVFGQLINVLSAVVQNIMLYVEDSTTEQNIYTAQRKKSIYSLAQLSGYNPSLGTSAGAQIKLSYVPTNTQFLNVVINNKEKLTCTQNGLQYNIILPQEAIVLNIEKDRSGKYLYAVEGKFETQSFVSTGGLLYTQNVAFSGDMDINYLEVYINDVLWTRKDGIYDMEPDGEQYVCKTSLTKGIDLVFGTDQYGRALQNGDTIKVVYLIHDGELGNIDPTVETYFTFVNPVSDISGESVDGNQIFVVTLATQDSVTSGTNSESKEQIRNSIGLNSRALVFASAENYKNFINKFSFCGYNRTWCEPGSFNINSLILRNYKQQLSSGTDYFNLKESDFFLTDNQKQSIYKCIANSGNQVASVVYNIYSPEICKYAMYVYVKMKDAEYDQEYVTNEIRKLVGEFFSNLENDMYIPKSDISHLLKSNIDSIDGVNVYFLSEQNETAIINGKYTTNVQQYDATTATYKTVKKTIYLDPDEDPNLGLDSHGNIALDNNEQFPVLMKGWSYKSGVGETTMITDPLVIVFETANDE